MQQHRAWVYLIIGVVSVTALWFAMRQLAPSHNGTSPGQQRIDIALIDGVHRGPGVFELTQDDEILLTIHSNRPEELHLHGYEKHIVVQADTPKTVRFVANLSGRHMLELHRNDATLCYLDVYPN